MISHPSRIGLCLLLAVLSGCPDSDEQGGNSRRSLDSSSDAKMPRDQIRLSSDSEVAAADTMILDGLELERLKATAVSDNDAEAAVRVGTHYLFLSDRTETLAVYWYSLAIAQEHGRAMENVAVRLYGIGGPENCAAALELLDRSTHAQLAPVDAADASNWKTTIENDREKCR